MKSTPLLQGSPEWLLHRSQHFNASDAPAMMGCSPHKTRNELLREMKTGIAAEVDAGTQRRFDDGHRFEALARPLAEAILDEELYPVVGSEGRLSASFDGLTMLEDIAFEHKSLNNELRSVMVDGCTGADLPKHYQIQMEQQCMVAGCSRVLFMASKWDGDQLVEERHCWYTSNDALAESIRAGWTQFEQDLAAYIPPETAQAVVAAPVTSLPAVFVQVSGDISIRENFSAFETAVRDFLEHRLIREPKTDQDFADLDLQIKAMKGAETALESAEAQMLAQIATVDTAKKTKDMLANLVRDNRLMAEKLLASEKERRRGEIVATGVKSLADHIAALNTRLGKPYMPLTAADFGGAIKGKKSLTSMEEAIGVTLANAKISANATADRIQVNLATLNDLAANHMFLFPDAAQIVLKQADDLTMLVKGRLAEHAAKEAARVEAERERIRAEEAARLERERLAEEREQQRQAEIAGAVLAVQAGRQAFTAPTAPLLVSSPVAKLSVPASPAPADVASAAKLKLGEINDRLAPISITADGLKQLGFNAVGRERAAVLFLASDFPKICAAISAHVLGATR